MLTILTSCTYCSLLLFSNSIFAQYELIDFRNTSMPNRARAHASIVSDVSGKKARINLVNKVIKQIEKETNAMVITVHLIASPDLYGAGALLAKGDYYADGCGASGKDCNDIKLKTRATDIKLTSKQIRIWEEAVNVIEELAELEIYDEEAINKQVAKNLKIKVSDVVIPYIELTE